MNRIDSLLAALEMPQSVEQDVHEIRPTNPDSSGPEYDICQGDDICRGKDSHRGPKIRGKGKKAYRGSL